MINTFQHLSILFNVNFYIHDVKLDVLLHWFPVNTISVVLILLLTKSYQKIESFCRCGPIYFWMCQVAKFAKLLNSKHNSFTWHCLLEAQVWSWQQHWWIRLVYRCTHTIPHPGSYKVCEECSRSLQLCSILQSLCFCEHHNLTLWMLKPFIC